jgi:DNA-binding PadR family transcriptional regulator
VRPASDYLCDRVSGDISPLTCRRHSGQAPRQRIASGRQDDESIDNICRSLIYIGDMNERPLQEPTLLLLTALADEPRHGYGLIQEIDAISQGRVRMRTGTLYGALDRLVQQGLIRVEREEVVDGRARKVYALAEAGRDVLAAETERLRAVVAEAERRLAARRAHVIRPKGALA